MRRNYALVIASTFILFWVKGMLYPVVPIYIKHISGDDFLVGLSFALPFFVTIPTSFLWGVLSDYIGKRKPILIYSGLIGACLFIAFPFLNAVELIALRTVQLFFLSSAEVLTLALVTEYFPKSKGKSIGDLHLFGGAGSTIGGLIVGFIVPSAFLQIGDPNLISFFLICTILTFVSIMLLGIITEVQKKPERKSLREMLKFGELKPIRKEIRNICLSAAVLQLALLMVYAIFPIFIEEEVIGPAANATMIVGVLSAIASLGGIIGSGVAGRVCDRIGRRKVFISSIIFYGIYLFLYSLTNNIYIIAVLWAIPIYSFFFVSATAMISDLTSDAERGRGIGILTSSVGVGGGFGALLGGYAANLWSFQFVFAFGIIFVAVSLVIALTIKETLKK